MQLTDIGANLTHPSFHDDLEAVVARARMAGIASIVVTGSTVLESKLAAEIAGRFGFHATAGVHPHHARDCGPATIGELRELAKHPRVVAIGECGLDFNRNYSPHPDQEKWFIAQLELGLELGKPLFLHSRDAHPRFAEILRHHRVSKAVASMSASPAGSATSAAARTCSSWCATSRTSACCSRPIRPISRRATCARNPSRAAMSLLFCLTY